MGLLSKLVLAPLAPVTGVVWLAEQLEKQASVVYHSPETVRAELEAVAAAHARGDVDAVQRDRLEADLIARLVEGGSA